MNPSDQQRIQQIVENIYSFLLQSDKYLPSGVWESRRPHGGLYKGPVPAAVAVLLSEYLPCIQREELTFFPVALSYWLKLFIGPCSLEDTAYSMYVWTAYIFTVYIQIACAWTVKIQISGVWTDIVWQSRCTLNLNLRSI